MVLNNLKKILGSHLLSSFINPFSMLNTGNPYFFQNFVFFSASGGFVLSEKSSMVSVEIPVALKFFNSVAISFYF